MQTVTTIGLDIAKSVFQVPLARWSPTVHDACEQREFSNHVRDVSSSALRSEAKMNGNMS